MNIDAKILNLKKSESESASLVLGWKESACNVGDPGSIPGSGRLPGEENGYPLLYSCLENSMDRGAWQTTRKKKIIYPYSL